MILKQDQGQSHLVREILHSPILPLFDHLQFLLDILSVLKTRLLPCKRQDQEGGSRKVDGQEGESRKVKKDG